MKPGDTIGRFRIEALLGEGGMGSVYRAHDPRLDRRVALKVLHVDAADGDPREALARLLREARAAAALDHPNAVAIFDVGDAEGVGYIAMELVEGVSLRHFVGRGDVANEQRVQWLVDVARALAAAHERGLVHRDVKPENVMVRPDGVVKVLDFGIARRLHASTSTAKIPLPSDPELIRRTLTTLTTDGFVMGTPLYMAPEQVRGDAVDARVDQFSWGVLAYELLAGQLPWEPAEEAIVTVERMLTTEPTPLHARGVALPAVVEAVVEKAMARKTADRFASMREIVEALQPFARASVRPPDVGRAGATRVDAPTERSWHRTQPARRRSRTLLVGVSLGVLAAASAGVLLARDRAAPRSPDAPPADSSPATPDPTVTTLADVPAPPSSSPEAVAAFRDGLASMRDGNVHAALDGFQRAVAADPDMAQAQLRLAVLSFWIGDVADGREAFARAEKLRARLGERDAGVMDAISPWIEHWPADVDEVARRLGALVERWPRDAELRQYRAHLLQDLGQMAASIDEARALAALDPQCANAYQVEFWSSLMLGDDVGAAQAAADCARALPSSAACGSLATRSLQNAGQCAALEGTARDAAARDPSNPRHYEMLAESLAALGRPHDAVLEVLMQRWARLRLQPKAEELADRARLALHEGHFDEALHHLDDYERAIADDANEPRHAMAALLRLGVLEETGHAADAGRFARQYLSRAEAWTHDASIDSEAIEHDPLPRMLAAEARAGLLPPADRDRRRDEWAAAWEARAPAFYHGSLWFSGWAAAARTPAELLAADAAMTRFAPLPVYHEYALGELLRGAVDLQAGRVADALTQLRTAAARCVTLAFPLEHVRATELLGEALERAGDERGACEAYGRTIALWGAATPRAVTADRARDRVRALRCAASP